MSSQETRRERVCKINKGMKDPAQGGWGLRASGSGWGDITEWTPASRGEAGSYASQACLHLGTRRTLIPLTLWPGQVASLWGPLISGCARGMPQHWGLPAFQPGSPALPSPLGSGRFLCCWWPEWAWKSNQRTKAKINVNMAAARWDVASWGARPPHAGDPQRRPQTAGHSMRPGQVPDSGPEYRTLGHRAPLAVRLLPLRLMR